MEANPHVTVHAEPQWLHPVQLGSSTLLRAAQSTEALLAVEAVLGRLVGDPYIDFMRQYYTLGRERFGANWGYCDQLTVLHAAARLVRPERYLEIGVFRGRSLSVVAQAAPQCALFAFDRWVSNYAGLENQGPDLVRTQLARVGHVGPVEFCSGPSAETIPRFLAERPGLDFDLITVDGDHTEAGARADLEQVLPRLRVGGVIVFDDIRHPKHPWLERVWDEVVGAHTGFSCAKYVDVGHGVAFGIRREHGGQIELLRGPAEDRLRALAQALEEAERRGEERVEAIEADRADRLRIIEQQGAQLSELAATLDGQQHEVLRLQAYVEHIERDRDARLAVIVQQGDELGRAQAAIFEANQRLTDFTSAQAASNATQAAHVAELTAQVAELTGREAELTARVAELTAHEADLTARGAELEAVVERHTKRLAEMEREQLRELQRLLQQADQLDVARALAARTMLGVLPPGRAARLRALLDGLALRLATAPGA